LKRLLAHLKVARCILVGHSLGCLIAARYTVMFPGEVAALVLIAPAVGYLAQKGFLPAQVADRIKDLDRLGPEQLAAKRGWMLLADRIPNPEVLCAVQAAMAAVRRPGYDQAARMLASGCIYDDAANIEAPAAVLRGGKDYATAPENGHFVYASLQLSSKRPFFRIIEDTGHAMCLEKPGEVARVITEFLEAEPSPEPIPRGTLIPVIVKRASRVS
jgi:pimeloyl-ACP methyl ester carboxylesterase